MKLNTANDAQDKRMISDSSPGMPTNRLAIMAMMLIVIGIATYHLLPPSEAGQNAVGLLAKVQTVSFGEVGYGGSIADSEDWFFTILSSRHPERLFRDLFERGTNEAKLYALAGLHLTDKASFRECATRFTQEDSPIRTQSGCIVSYSTPKEAAAAIESGDIERYVELRK